jgi:hypothetical protein
LMDDPATAGAKAAEAIAKTTGQALEIIHDTGGYLRGVFGDVPADLVGVLVAPGCMSAKGGFGMLYADARSKFCEKGMCKRQ